MYEKFLGVVSAVIDPYLPKRHIADDYIKMVVWEICFLKALNGNVRFLVELLCNPACERVDFHAVELAVLHTFGKQTKEIACTAGRLQDIAL